MWSENCSDKNGIERNGPQEENCKLSFESLLCLQILRAFAASFRGCTLAGRTGCRVALSECLIWVKIAKQQSRSVIFQTPQGVLEFFFKWLSTVATQLP